MAAPPSIKCPKCGRTSYHADDIRRRYCGNCKLFHNEMPLDVERAQRLGPSGPNPYDVPRRRRGDWLPGPQFWLGVAVGGLFMFTAMQCGYTQTKPSAWYAIDGDTIVDGSGNHIRLAGIDAPELAQTCDGQPVGQWAKARLAELLKMGPVNCHKQSTDRYGRTIAVCTNGRLDLGQTMVQEGLARAYTRYSTAYAADEGGGPYAQYHCQNPEDWRRAHPK